MFQESATHSGRIFPFKKWKNAQTRRPAVTGNDSGICFLRRRHGPRSQAIENHAERLYPPPSQRLKTEKRMVDRPQSGSGHQDHIGAQAPDEVNDKKVSLHRYKQASASFDDEKRVTFFHFFEAAIDLAHGDAPAFKLRRDIGRKRTAKPDRARASKRLVGARAGLKQADVFRPAAGYRFHHPDAHPLGNESRNERPRDDGFPDARIGSRDEQFSHERASPSVT